MGQQSSSQMCDFVDSVRNIYTGVTTSSMPDDFLTITYDELNVKLADLNKLSNQCLDSSGKKLLFLIKKGTDESVFWKVKIRIACVKVDPETKDVHSYKLIDLRRFLRIFHTLQVQMELAAESKHNEVNVAEFYHKIVEFRDDEEEEGSLEASVECCICLERKPDISLPCAHTYCLQCIEEWSEDHDTCPVCREHLVSKDDTWILSEMPKAEEICEATKELLRELTDDKD